MPQLATRPKWTNEPHEYAPHTDHFVACSQEESKHITAHFLMNTAMRSALGIKTEQQKTTFYQIFAHCITSNGIDLFAVVKSINAHPLFLRGERLSIDTLENVVLQELQAYRTKHTKQQSSRVSNITVKRALLVLWFVWAASGIIWGVNSALDYIKSWEPPEATSTAKTPR